MVAPPWPPIGRWPWSALTMMVHCSLARVGRASTAAISWPSRVSAASMASVNCELIAP
nr:MULTISPECIES: hypothetical protein [unclassified Frankia]